MCAKVPVTCLHRGILIDYTRLLRMCAEQITPTHHQNRDTDMCRCSIIQLGYGRNELAQHEHVADSQSNERYTVEFQDKNGAKQNNTRVVPLDQTHNSSPKRLFADPTRIILQSSYFNHTAVSHHNHSSLASHSPSRSSHAVVLHHRRRKSWAG